MDTLEAVTHLWVTYTLQVILLTVTLFSSGVNTPLVCTNDALRGDVSFRSTLLKLVWCLCQNIQFRRQFQPPQSCVYHWLSIATLRWTQLFKRTEWCATLTKLYFHLYYCYQGWILVFSLFLLRFLPLFNLRQSWMMMMTATWVSNQHHFSTWIIIRYLHADFSYHVNFTASFDA